MILFVVLGQHVVMASVVYSSIEQMGERIGAALPSGYVDLSPLGLDLPHLTVTLNSWDQSLAEIPRKLLDSTQS